MKISACLITYNHENYIVECLEGAIKQQLNCDYEIIIGEDFSSDSTLKICKEYAEKYPDLIRLLPSVKNLGMMGNWIRTISQCEGEYLAICEGDDYWVDPLKLQKQVDFLQKNKNYSFSFHGVHVKNEVVNLKYSYPLPPKRTLEFKDILKKHYIATCSIMFRRDDFPVEFPSFFKNFGMADIPLELMLASKGKIYFFLEEMAVYRKNAGGITLSAEQKRIGRKSYIDVYSNILKYLFPKHLLILSFMLLKTKAGYLKDYLK